MRQRATFTRSIAVVTVSVFLGGSLMACNPQRPWGRCAVIGGATGAAVGGGAGAGIGYGVAKDNDNKGGPAGTGAMIGVLVGGAIGAIIGHFACDPYLAPPAPSAPAPVPHAAPPPPPAKEKLVLRGVHFDFAKYNIRPGDAAVLDEAAATLKANPGVTVNVDGHTDSVGSLEYNQKLSERRANAVVKYLVKAGIPDSQLVPHGYGKTKPVATNDTAEGRAQNRRCELNPQ
jgi:OmpA-OmpF porin, OOP family